MLSPTPKPRYPKQLKHLGDHLRARRIELGLLQKDAATRIGVDPATVTNWELGHSEPEQQFLPALIKFIGFNPLAVPTSHGASVRRERTSRGWSMARLAALAGVDAATVARLESDTKGMARRPVQRIRRALGM